MPFIHLNAGHDKNGNPRRAFVREFGVPNLGEPFNNLDIISGGQVQEKREVYDLVLAALQEIAGTEDEA